MSYGVTHMIESNGHSIRIEEGEDNDAEYNKNTKAGEKEHREENKESNLEKGIDEQPNREEDSLSDSTAQTEYTEKKDPRNRVKKYYDKQSANGIEEIIVIAKRSERDDKEVAILVLTKLGDELRWENSIKQRITIEIPHLPFQKFLHYNHFPF